jgi:hypothetical protein
LKVFGCRASVHVLRDERSKLDSKTKQCIYLSQPSEEFGYRLWDPVNKKIVRRRDVVFIKDEIIKDIGKPEKPMTNTPQVDMNPICPPLVHDNHGGDDDTEDSGDAIDQGSTSQRDEQPSSDGDDDVGYHDANDNPPDSPPVQQQRRSDRGHVPSFKYAPHQYVLMTDAGEPLCYEESMSDEHKNEWSEAMQDGMKSLYDDTFELVNLPKGKKTLKNGWV